MEKSFITSGPGYCCSLSTNSSDIEASSETFSMILVVVIVDLAVLFDVFRSFKHATYSLL